MLSFVQTLDQMLAHVGGGGQSPPQLPGLVGQRAAQDGAGGPGPLLLGHAPPQQRHLLLRLPPRLAPQPLGLPLLFFKLLRQSLNFLSGRFKISYLIKSHIRDKCSQSKRKLTRTVSDGTVANETRTRIQRSVSELKVTLGFSGHNF